MNSQLATRNSQLATRNSQLATRNSQLPTQNSQIATHNSLYLCLSKLKFFVFLLVFTSVLGGAFQMNAQVVCTDLLPTRDSTVFDSVNYQSSMEGTTYIKLYFHIYYHYDTFHGRPIGVDIQRCRDVKEILNEQFEDTGFQFFFNECEVDSIEDRHGARGNEVNIPEHLFCKRQHEDGIDIHLRSDVNQANLALSSAIGGGEFIVGGNYNNFNGLPISLSTTLAHEMGHCFGLYHTYTGTCDEDFSSFICEGSPMSTNSLTGDFVDDTPFDHYKPKMPGQKTNCDFEEDPGKDCDRLDNPVEYVNNYMQAYPYICSNEFTQGQIEKMHRDALQDVRYDQPNSHDLTIDKDGTCEFTLTAITTCNEENLSYLWSTGETTESIEVSENGTYTVEVTDPHGNISIESIEVSELLELEIETGYMPGCNGGIELIAEVESGVPPYSYSWNTGSTESSIIIESTCGKEYEVTVTDQNGCTLYESIIADGSRFSTPNHPIGFHSNKTYNGILYVLDGCELTITSTVEFSERGGIVVQRGAKLILDGGTLTKCDQSDSWRGIVVEGNSNQAQPDPTDPAVYDSDQAGIVITKNNAVIEYAETGIRTNYSPCDGWSKDYWGGVVHSEHTSFKNNRVGVSFMKYDYPNKSQFYYCDFFRDNNYTHPSTNTFGMTIWGCRDIEVERCHVQNVRTGISGDDFSAEVINGNIIEDCYYGFRSRATYPFASEIKIGSEGTVSNDFRNNLRAIDLMATDRMTGAQIMNNEIYITGSYNFPVDLHTGIYVGGASQFEIRDNVINDLFFPSFVSQTGIGLNKIRCNTIANDEHQEANGIIIRNENTGLEILTNDFIITSDCKSDIRIFGDQYQGSVRAAQGAPGRPAGNCFSKNGRLEIEAIENTKYFEYFFSLDDQNPDSCFVPTENLTDGGPNNYDREITEDLIGNCAEEGTSGPSTFSQGETLSSLRDSAEQLWDQGQYQNAVSLLLNDGESHEVRLAYGMEVSLNHFQSADSILSLLNGGLDTLSDATEFYQVQTINLRRLQDLGDSTAFQLTPSEESQLQTIAGGQSYSSSYARALLEQLGLEYFAPEPTADCYDEWEIQYHFDSDEEEQDGSFSIYPNPGEDRFYIKGPIGRITDLRLYAASGDEVSTQMELQKVIQSGIDLSHLPAGIYHLILMVDTDEQIIRKIVKH